MIRRTQHASRSRRAVLSLSISGVLVAGAAIAGIAVSAPAQAASNNLITIQTVSSGDATITRYDADGATSTQTLSSAANKCNPAVSGNVVSMLGSVRNGTPTAGLVGLRQGSLGVAEKSSGESCAQVSATGSEKLTISLTGTDLASLAVLDLELQKDAIVVADLYRGASVRSVEVQSGASIGARPEPGVADADVATCQVASSSGPNSGPSDNCRWLVSGGLFDKIVLRAVKGLFSLEGGSDGTVSTVSATQPTGLPTDVSFFSLALACTSDTTVSSGDATGLEEKITVTQWAQPTADGQDCLTTPLIVKAKDGEVEFIKNGQPYSQFLITIEWRYPLSTPVTATTVNFGSDDDDETLDWCPSSVRSSTDSGLTWVGPNEDFPDVTSYLESLGFRDMDGNTGNSLQYACSGSTTESTYVAENTTTGVPAHIAMTESIYLIGDVIFRG